ncbi:MAG: exopolyphosphatase / guanosine-5'-triphosphate 3'-diphosphate [Geobacteraceae bacterium]|nr:MAG: exopolyphosphatase / guanosine-5'-triphosphate 3'-diphosphate [Geobacteraceae bacterium]
MVKRNRLAAIDIGTNSIRCIVVEADKRSKFKVLDDEKATVRLGEGFARDHAISPAAWQRAVDALSRMKKIVDGYGVQAVETVATSAVREAANGAAFVDDIAEKVGLNVSVISGEEEAELAALSALNNFDMEGVRYAMVDIGGGSVEVVTALGNHIEEIYSFDLGAVFLTENFITSDPIRSSDYLKLRKYVRKTLKGALVGEGMPVQCMLGSGGTMTSIAAMVMAMRKEGYGSIHGYEVLRSEVVHLLAMLMRKDLKGRKSVPGLNPDRADIIVAGVTVVDELMAFFNANVLKINERGIREGLILKSLRNHNLLPAGVKARGWRESVLEFARSCHNDEEHSRQVARLSLIIFDAAASSFSLGERERQMLEAAALLHDVGYFISYSGHHKHTYHLVRHADLFGFTPREREIIAQIARYHRKALPKKKHESFARLALQDRLLVMRLGGILRFADGLDRRRNSLVSALDCSLSPSTFMVRLMSEADVSVELFGGKVKGDLFEKAFDRKIMLVSAPGAEQLCAAGRQGVSV